MVYLLSLLEVSVTGVFNMPRRLAALCDLLGDQCRRILILVLRRKKSCNIEISKAPLKNAKKKVY